MSEQIAWLIERKSKAGTPLYWSGFGVNAWTFNPDGAVRFQRKVDAERVVEGFGFDAIVTEHLWMVGSAEGVHQEHADATRRSAAHE